VNGDGAGESGRWGLYSIGHAPPGWGGLQRIDTPCFLNSGEFMQSRFSHMTSGLSLILRKFHSAAQNLLTLSMRRLRDSETQRCKDSEAPRLKDSDTQRLRDSGNQGLRDSETQRLRESGTQGLRDSEMQRLRGSETQRLRYSETQGLRDSKTPRRKDSEAQRLRDSLLVQSLCRLQV